MGCFLLLFKIIRCFFLNVNGIMATFVYNIGNTLKEMTNNEKYFQKSAGKKLLTG